MDEQISKLDMEGLLDESVNDESDESENDLIDLEKTDFSQAVIWGTDWTTESIVSQLRKGNIDLQPSFQRRDAWSDIEKSRFIESLMLGLPVPPIILAESKTMRNRYLVIDGKQRLLSIMRFYSLVTDKEIKEKALQEKDVFKQLKLRGLSVLKDFNGLGYDKVREKDNNSITSLENQPIRTIVIRNWPSDEFLYLVFLRLNTGSKKLSPQELRQALHPGPFLNFLDKATCESEVIRKMLNNKAADARMRDIELALRYFALKYNFTEYNGNLKTFLDTTCEKMNKLWESKEQQFIIDFNLLENTINYSYSVMKNKMPFSRYKNSECSCKFNRPIYELFTYYFSNNSIKKIIDNNVDAFINAFISLNNEPDFIQSVSDTTKDINRVIYRFNRFANLLISLHGGEDLNLPILDKAQGENKIIFRQK